MGRIGSVVPGRRQKAGGTRYPVGLDRAVRQGVDWCDLVSLWCPFGVIFAAIA